MYFEGELPVMSYGNCNNGNNGWNDWSWIIGLALVGGLFGNGGFGFGNGGRGNYCGTPATTADLAAGFNNSAVLGNLNDIILGQAQMQNFVNQGFAGLNATINAGFNGVDNAVCTLGYNTQAGFNALANQLATCCCDTRAAIADVKYSNERQTCDIIQAINAGNQRLVDIYTGDKIAALTAENSALKGQISNDRQSAYITDTILDRLSPCPKPAYLTCNPNAPYGLGYGIGFGFNGGCCGASIQ